MQQKLHSYTKFVNAPRKIVTIQTLIVRQIHFSQTEISLIEDGYNEHHMQENQNTSVQNVPKLDRWFIYQFYNHYANCCESKSYCAQYARISCTKNCKKMPGCINCIRTSNKLNLKSKFSSSCFL